MQPADIRQQINDGNRMAVAGVLAGLFDDVADLDQANPVSRAFGRTMELGTLMCVSPYSVGVVLDEIGYLAGTVRPEMGVVAQGLRLVGERMHEDYLGAQEAAQYRRMQDGSHIMLHLANMALPREPAGGVKPVDSEPLRKAFGRLAEDADFAHVIQLSRVVLDTLQWRQWNYELAGLAPGLQEQKRSAAIEGTAPLYEDVMKNATRAITRLAIDKAAVRL